jgi:hypothetical protein
MSMSTLEDIEKAVESLSPDKLAQFRAWFEQFEAALFDAKIARDAENGTLDRLVAESEEDFRSRHYREI